MMTLDQIAAVARPIIESDGFVFIRSDKPEPCWGLATKDRRKEQTVAVRWGDPGPGQKRGEWTSKLVAQRARYMVDAALRGAR